MEKKIRGVDVTLKVQRTEPKQRRGTAVSLKLSSSSKGDKGLSSETAAEQKEMFANHFI